jgi:crotonobetainyl-CoA:carnitine CoA-transferase CaiB-like acyl-CoA transferase
MAEDLTDEKWKDEEYRLRNIDHVMDILQRWTRTHSAQELLELSQFMRFPWAPIYSLKDVLNNAQLQAREFFIDVEHPEIGKPLKYPGAPYKFSHFSWDRWKRAPLIGEDNIQIYQRELGLSNEELRRLSFLGVI